LSGASASLPRPFVAQTGSRAFTVDYAFAFFESLRVDVGTLGPFGIKP
jgi:hypothetical protein